MDEKLPHVQDGEDFTAEAFNEAAARIERFLNLRVADGVSGGLTLYKDRYGMVLSYQPPRWTIATLSGSTSPYSWHEAAPASSGTWASYGQRSGTGNAYEINGVSGLGGKTVRMWWTGAKDWRFNYSRVGSSAAPAPVGCDFCVQLFDQCTSSLLTPTSADLKLGGSVAYNATLGNQTLGLVLGNPGSGYANGWHTLGFSGGCSVLPTGEFFVSGGHVTQAVLTTNGSGCASPPTVSFPGAGGTGAAATASVGMAACFQAVASNTYTLEASASGYLTYSGSYAPCGNTSVSLSPATTTVTGSNIVGCFSHPLSGVGVSAVQTGTGGVSQVTTTNGSGAFSFASPFASNLNIVFTFTDPQSRFSIKTATYTLNACGGNNFDGITHGVFTTGASVCEDGFDEVTGYSCFCTGTASCAYPLKKPLHFSDAAGGSCSLTYSCDGVTEVWSGTYTATFPGCSGTLLGTPISCPSGGVTATVQFSRHTGSGCADLIISWKTKRTFPGGVATDCPDDSGTNNGSTGGLTVSSLTCPPAFNATFNIGAGGCGTGWLWPSGTTITISE